MAGKFRLGELRQLHSKLGAILSDYDEAKAAEAASDNPPEFQGKPAAMDSAPSLDTRIGRKGLTHVPNTAATRALHNMPGYNRLTK